MIESLHGGQLPQKLFGTHSGCFMNKNKPLLAYITESSEFFCYGIIQFILTNNIFILACSLWKRCHISKNINIKEQIYIFNNKHI